MKGRCEALLGRVPVRVIPNNEVALVGAACHGLGAYDEDGAMLSTFETERTSA